MAASHTLTHRALRRGSRALRIMGASFALTTLLLLAVYTNQDTSQPASTKPRSTGSARRHSSSSTTAGAATRRRTCAAMSLVTPWSRAPDQRGPEYVNGRAVARALAHVLAGKHPDLAVHAFCR